MIFSRFLSRRLSVLCIVFALGPGAGASAQNISPAEAHQICREGYPEWMQTLFASWLKSCASLAVKHNTSKSALKECLKSASQPFQCLALAGHRGVNGIAVEICGGQLKCLAAIPIPHTPNQYAER